VISTSWLAGIIGMSHHAQLSYLFLTLYKQYVNACSLQKIQTPHINAYSNFGLVYVNYAIIKPLFLKSYDPHSHLHINLVPFLLSVIKITFHSSICKLPDLFLCVFIYHIDIGRYRYVCGYIHTHKYLYTSMFRYWHICVFMHIYAAYIYSGYFNLESRAMLDKIL
jgi:hypothetical protein